jgi:hypothetical protein
MNAASTSDEVNMKLLQDMMREAESISPGPYSGLSWRELDRFGRYEEPGLMLTKEDKYLIQHYAGLAVLCKDIHGYLAKCPREDAKLFEEVVAAVNAEDGRRYGPTTFPYDSPDFPYMWELARFPKGLAERAARGEIIINELADAAIRHEWTVKPGKKLLLKFAGKFKEVTCGKDGPYERFKNGLVGQADLPIVIAVQILTVGISTAVLWYPLAIYIGLLLVKTGLKTYCE